MQLSPNCINNYTHEIDFLFYSSQSNLFSLPEETPFLALSPDTHTHTHEKNASLIKLFIQNQKLRLSMAFSVCWVSYVDNSEFYTGRLVPTNKSCVFCVFP